MFYKKVEEVLLAKSPKEKEKLFFSLWREFLDDKFTFESSHKAQKIQKPSFDSLCQVVDPQSVPKFRDLNSDKGLASFLHSIIHIEYSAIDLALDACYRFRDLPKDFYHDWLEVAKEEIEHFKMLESLLHSLGYKYGDFKVHSGLWDATLKTPTLIERMAFIPRHLEANGLDVNEKLALRVSKLRHPLKDKILQSLVIILEEEISHVRKGDKWFKYACKIEEKDPDCYFDILEAILPNSTTKREVNIKARKEAGFSFDELKKISSEKLI